MKTPAELESALSFVIREVGEGVRAHLARERTPAMAREIVDHAFAYEAKAKATLVAKLVRGTKSLPVCAPACAWCCHSSVFASVPEIFRIAAHLRDMLDAARLGEARARVREAAAIVAPLSKTDRARARQACPLLDRATNMCSAYEARPLSCRAYNSCDAGVCQRAYEEAREKWDLPIEITQYTVARHVRAGIVAGTMAAGLDAGPYELAVGVAIALDTPDAEARWLRGEPVFAAAETTVGREMRAEWNAHHAKLARDLRVTERLGDEQRGASTPTPITPSK